MVVSNVEIQHEIVRVFHNVRGRLSGEWVPVGTTSADNRTGDLNERFHTIILPTPRVGCPSKYSLASLGG